MMIIIVEMIIMILIIIILIIMMKEMTKKHTKYMIFEYIFTNFRGYDFMKTSQELGNCPMGQRKALLKERLY